MVLYDPVENYCSLSFFSSLVIQNHLYIQGGGATYYNYTAANGVPAYEDGFTPYLRDIDLNQSFDLSSAYRETTISTAATYPFDIPQTQNSLFWHDDAGQIVYLVGGGSPANLSDVLANPSDFTEPRLGKMWTAKVGGQGDLSDWTEVDMDFSQQQSIPVTGMRTFDQESRKGFSLGENYPVGSDSMLIFNAATSKWTNSAAIYPGGTIYGDGGLVSLNLNGQVAVIAFGSQKLGDKINSLDTINIYLESEDNWYTQKTSSGGPVAMYQFCSTILSSPDGSNHQIIIYGGIDSKDEVYSTIWSLNIPSFRWVLLDSGESDDSPQQRASANCHIINNHFLLVQGGRKLATANLYPTCDTKGLATFVYDLNSQSWLPSFDASDTSAYEVPSKIFGIVGGDSSGGATVLTPKDGFDSPALAKFFGASAVTTSAVASNAVTTSTTAPTNTATTSSPSEKSDSNSTSSSVPIGAVVGGVIGGLAIILQVIFVIWWMRRKSKKKAERKARGNNFVTEDQAFAHPYAQAYGQQYLPRQELEQPPPRNELGRNKPNDSHSQVYELH